MPVFHCGCLQTPSADVTLWASTQGPSCHNCERHLSVLRELGWPTFIPLSSSQPRAGHAGPRESHECQGPWSRALPPDQAWVTVHSAQGTRGEWWAAGQAIDHLRPVPGSRQRPTLSHKDASKPSTSTSKPTNQCHPVPRRSTFPDGHGGYEKCGPASLASGRVGEIYSKP